MKVPLLDLKPQYAAIKDEIREAIDRVCDSQYFILGPEVADFERAVAEFCGTRCAVGMSSGTDALLAALMAIGVGPNDEVMTSSYSFFASAAVIVRLGARPVFVDIDPVSFNLDPEAAVSRITPRSRAIMPVHLFGRCADVAPMMEAAEAHGLVVIEDAAQALSAKDEAGRRAGALGQMGCFSFFPSKNLGGFGDGGMVTTDDEELAEMLRVLRMQGGAPKYEHKVVGGNFRLDALQAAVLRVKLKYLDGWSGGRRANADRYRALFEENGLLDQVRVPEDVPGHVYNQFVIRVPDRDRLREFMTEREIGTEIYYPIPLHLQESMSYLGYKEGDLPEAEAAARESLALPVYPELTEEQQRYVVGTIREFYG
ncbi:MAG: DegT/DnrJ/EryC1/StrS family aminotransferase [Gemmatimonadota bacterium]|nr:MAG: DegT/DnrJ/EryC1/StrS family aminotransferase [Gemmatimonadota bacterium]